MIVYLDLIFFINFFYDFLLLLTVDVVLKRKAKLWKHLLSALVGALSIFLLFIPLNEKIVFLIKIMVSILMVLICFKYISFKYTFNNIAYLYMCSIILAGFLYYLNNEFSLQREGFIFFNNGISINYLLLLIVSPIILFLYYQSSKNLKKQYNLYHRIEIVFDNYQVKCLSLLDTGNNLKDPITGKSVIILKPGKLSKVCNIRSPVYIPYNTISGSGIIRCYKPSYIIINGKKIYNYLVGETKYKFSDGVECILNVKLMEDNYV